jgi:predicted FMN-binding regulatory protein PaiB
MPAASGSGGSWSPRVPDEVGQARLIEDHYLDGMSLRLRRVSDETATTYKITQKIRDDPADPSTVALTSIYLTEVEYTRLRGLPGAALRKTRRATGSGPR